MGHYNSHIGHVFVCRAEAAAMKNAGNVMHCRGASQCEMAISIAAHRIWIDEEREARDRSVYSLQSRQTVTLSYSLITSFQINIIMNW